MSDNYSDEIRPLFKLLRNPAFRFIIVCYNHFNLVRRLEQDLQEQFPDRPFRKVNAQKTNYQEVSKSYSSLDSGFFWLENFDDVLREERNSLGQETPEMAQRNERRRHITAGLNLRRDKLAKIPVALFVFLPTTAGELFARRIMEKMPDLWSFRSLILDLRQEIPAIGRQIDVAEFRQERLETSSLGGSGLQEKEAELRRLLEQLEQTPRTETAYRLTLYPQVVVLQTELGYYNQALGTLGEWEGLSDEDGKAAIWEQKGKLYTDSGDLGRALEAYQKMSDFFLARFTENPENPYFKTRLASAYEELGKTYSALGNLDKASTFFEDEIELLEELFKSSPQNVSLKNSLANSYSKLGALYSTLGNWDLALFYFEKDIQLSTELCTAFPENLDFKNGLAVSFAKLGETHSTLGNLAQALTFFEQYNQLEKELYEAFPQNASFKNNLAISYAKIGEMHTVLGHWDNVLSYFEKANQFLKELHNTYPQNVSFTNSLAISYEKLGETHAFLKNLGEAETYFKEEITLFEELNKAFPNHLLFKNGLAIAYAKMGEFSKDHLNDISQSRTYFQQAENLWAELVHDVPQQVQFQQYLSKVRADLAGLEK